ncbi:MAG: hypothetical protein EYC70_14265 [Planctomycetota bacterium]|nr:MAG: hypothetical protein EYC70_14265 [Planctomycetota bacterium]
MQPGRLTLLLIPALGALSVRPAAAQDFNADGRPDLAVGVPYEDGGADMSGTVHVFYGEPGGFLTAANHQIWSQGTTGLGETPEAGDRFGYALAWGDINADGYDDLAIGIPGEDYASYANAGAVAVLYGYTRSGLTAIGNQFWTDTSIRAGDHFGLNLAGGGAGDGSFLAISSPNRDVGAAVDAGAVTVLYGDGYVNGLVPDGRQVWTQNSPGIGDACESYDLFGFGRYGG